MLRVLDCASPFALFLRAIYLLSLMLGCSDFAVAIENLMGVFPPPFHSILLIRKVGFSLSNLTTGKKKSPFQS